MGQTVNLLSFDFGGSNPSLPTNKLHAVCVTYKSNIFYET